MNFRPGRGGLQVFAERVLLGERLEDKLGPLEELSDVDPHPLPRKLVPGRPPEWPLRDGRAKVKIPSGVERAEDRAQVLHSFAIHELLALELLAHAILRFPEADPRLRRAWAVTAADEQRHLARYLERLHAVGSSLGAFPGSAFFWDVLHDAPDPAAFTIGLSLVLEQANLDFTRTWRKRFAAAGDNDTAAVLDDVYADEIRHVRVGVALLPTLARDGESAFDTFARSLTFPLTPARARGTEVDREGRRAAGLTEAFVDRLVVWGMSKGRDPKVYLFDPHVEDAVAGRSVSPSAIERDLALVPLWLASADDVVITSPPRPEFLLSLAGCGVEIPQFIERVARSSLPNGRVGTLVPWGWSPRTAARLAPLGGRWDPALAPVFSKAWAAERARAWVCPVAHDPADLGVVCWTEAEVEAALTGISWIKAAYSASGTLRIRVERLDARSRTWLGRAFVSGPVVVEPHLDVVAELSVQAEVSDRVPLVGITRFWAEHGVYRGSVVGRPDLGLPADVLRFLNSPRSGAVFDALRDAARFVGSSLAAVGFRGAYGLDALVVRGANGLRLRGISEVNARLTMGRVALALAGRLAPGSVGAWLFVPKGKGLGRTTDVQLDNGRVRAGLVATTDPQTAERIETWLVVDRSWEAVRARAAERGLHVP